MSSQASVKLEKSRELILGKRKYPDIPISRSPHGTKCTIPSKLSLGLVGPVTGMSVICWETGPPELAVYQDQQVQNIWTVGGLAGLMRIDG